MDIDTRLGATGHGALRITGTCLGANITHAVGRSMLILDNIGVFSVYMQ